MRCGVTLCVLVAVARMASGAGLADEWALPLVTWENAKEHADQPARLEATVVEVKFAQRRKLHFLSATPNFRADNNLPVAIRDADIAKFHEAGIKDMSARYLGQKIRARGTVVRDEGQWLLVVTSPGQIELQDNSPKPAASSKLVVINEHGAGTTLTVPLAAELPRSKIAVEHEGKQETYEGISLAALLERAGVRLGAEARGKLLGRYVVVRARDGYAAVFSVAEVDPFLVERPALLADRVNGESLPATKAPLQIVLPGDKHRRRWVGQVISIEVRNALDQPAAGKP